VGKGKKVKIKERKTSRGPYDRNMAFFACDVFLSSQLHVTHALFGVQLFMEFQTKNCAKIFNFVK
jgi:uncharacterized membrane protein